MYWHKRTQKVEIALRICILKVLHKGAKVIEGFQYNKYCHIASV